MTLSRVSALGMFIGWVVKLWEFKKNSARSLGFLKAGIDIFEYLLWFYFLFVLILCLALYDGRPVDVVRGIPDFIV